MVGSYVGLAVALLAVALVIASYNRLVRLRHEVAKTWANIDVLLKQRNDELPKLVGVCRRHTDFERETLERVMHARSAALAARETGDVPAVGRAESRLRAGLARVFAVAEAYPDLTSGQSFQELQGRIVDLEDAIADRRVFYNETVNTYNVGIEVFPDVVLARLFTFRPAPLLQFDENERTDIDMPALLAQ